MIEKVDHIGIAVKEIGEALKVYSDAFGLNCTAIEEVIDQKAKVAILPLGECRIELVQPVDPDSPLAKSIEKRGEGIHHIALKVNNIELVLKKLKEKGLKLIDERPRIGAGGAKIAFLHPKSTHNVLIELVER